MSSKLGRAIAAAQHAKAVSIPPAHRHKVAGSKLSPITKKVKKMGWFRKKFNKWVREAWENARSEEVYATDTIRSHDGINGKSSYRFTVYPASGGFVIESYKQDRYKENDGPDLTIVNHGEDLGKALEYIITLEALRS